MRTAYFVSWLLAPHVKKGISAQQIYDGLWTTEETKQQQKVTDRKILLDEFADVLKNDKRYNPTHNTD